MVQRVILLVVILQRSVVLVGDGERDSKVAGRPTKKTSKANASSVRLLAVTGSTCWLEWGGETWVPERLSV